MFSFICSRHKKKNKNRHDNHKITPILTSAHHSYQVGESSLCHKKLHIHLTKNYIITKSNLNNYNDHIDLRNHMQNVRNILELVIIENGVMCKIFPTTFHWFAWSSSLILALAFLLKTASRSSFPFHNEVMKAWRHISKDLTRKCHVWKICLNSSSPKLWSTKRKIISYRKSYTHYLEKKIC